MRALLASCLRMHAVSYVQVNKIVFERPRVYVTVTIVWALSLTEGFIYWWYYQCSDLYFPAAVSFPRVALMR